MMPTTATPTIHPKKHQWTMTLRSASGGYGRWSPTCKIFSKHP